MLFACLDKFIFLVRVLRVYRLINQIICYSYGDENVRAVIPMRLEQLLVIEC